jgi:hypothetical protein
MTNNPAFIVNENDSQLSGSFFLFSIGHFVVYNISQNVKWFMENP